MWNSWMVSGLLGSENTAARMYEGKEEYEEEGEWLMRVSAWWKVEGERRRCDLWTEKNLEEIALRMKG